MAIKHIIIFALSFVLFGSVSAQQVKLSRLSRALGQDSIIISNASGVAGWYPKSSLGYLSGSGTSGHVAVWSGTSLTSTGWEMAATWLQSQSTFGPALRLTNCNFTFNGDNDTGIKRIGADIVGIHAGDATNPLITIDGPGEAIYFDPDDDGTDDVTISATKTSVELLNIGGFDTDNTTHLEGVDASGDVTKVAMGNGLQVATGASVDTVSVNGWFLPTMANVHYNGTENLLSTSDTLINYPFTMASTLAYGDIDVDDNNGTVIVEFDGVVHVTFSCHIDNQGSDYTGSIFLYVYVNNTDVSTLTQGVELMTANERKVLSFQANIEVSNGDELYVRYEQSSVADIFVQFPNLTVTRIR